MNPQTTLLVASWTSDDFDAVVDSADMPVTAISLDGSRYVAGVNERLPDVTTKWVALLDGSSVFAPGAREECERAMEARIADVVVPYQDGVPHWRPANPACSFVQAEYLRSLGGLDDGLTVVGWEVALAKVVEAHGGRLATLRSAQMVTREDLARDEALGDAYYDQIRDYDVLAERGYL